VRLRVRSDLIITTARLIDPDGRRRMAITF
jgi:hypothetical protein